MRASPRRSPRRVVISGSFRRHLTAIQRVVSELRDRGWEVLSPSDPRVVDEFGEFLFVASDRLRSIRAVQGRHLASIRSADFVWLVDPDGYVGQSAAMEIGFALAVGTPVHSLTPPTDLTLRQYVQVMPSLEATLRVVAARPSGQGRTPILVDPSEGAGHLHQTIEALENSLTTGSGREKDEDLARAFAEAREMLEFH